MILEKVARVYNRGSVIESRLVGWLEDGVPHVRRGAEEVSGSVAYTGEGEWTVKTGKKWKMKLPAIEDAFKFRVRIPESSRAIWAESSPRSATASAGTRLKRKRINDRG